MVNLDARKENGYVIISEDSFEHLLNCLDNQKFIDDINADALMCDYKRIQKKTQEVIDDFNKQCRDLLNS